MGNRRHVCAGCGVEAPEAVDALGWRRMTPPGWLWLTMLGRAGEWYFCSAACVGRWAAQCRPTGATAETAARAQEGA